MMWNYGWFSKRYCIEHVNVYLLYKIKCIFFHIMSTMLNVGTKH